MEDNLWRCEGGQGELGTQETNDTPLTRAEANGLTHGWFHWGLKAYRPSAPLPTGTLPHSKHKIHSTDSTKEPMSVRIKEAVPSAPPLEQMDAVTGYEGTSYDAVTMPPPATFFEPLEGSAPIREAFSRGRGITEEDARKALLQYVSQQCCYGTAAARQLAVTKIHYSSAFHYKLETFTEKRQTCWTYEPHTGECLDAVTNGRAPLPWEIKATPPTMFRNHTKHIEVPHTASLKPCNTCKASGTLQCVPCLTQGSIRCVHCHGDGTRVGSNGEREPCFFCHGMGKEKCSHCQGSGKTVCKQCGGKGQVKCYIKLTVTWTNNVADHIVERTSLPSELIKGVTGQVAFEEELVRVWPINHFPDNTINMASAQLVQEHANAFPSERVLMQKQQVRIVPVTEVHYQWNAHIGKFYVYGFENQIHAPDYPQTCCWGCIII